MSFFSKILDKTKDLLGIQKNEKPKIEEPSVIHPDELPLDAVQPLPSGIFYDHNDLLEETDAKKIIDDFELKHPWACELFKSDIAKIKDNSDNVDLLTDYWKNCKDKVDLYNGCIRDVIVINYIRSHISVKLKPEVVFEVQSTVQENIELIKDLIPYVIKLFIYDCKKVVFDTLEFLHFCKKEIGISKKSIADDFVNKIAMGVTQRIREMLADNFSEEKTSVEFDDKVLCKELVDIASIAKKYNKLCKSNRNISFTLDDIVGDEYRMDLSNHIDKVISRYENRHLVDKIKDYALILWYVLRFFYSIFFGAGFLYLIWLGKNLDNWGNNIDSFFIKAGDLLSPQGSQSASQLIAPMLAAALSKVTIILVVLGAAAVLVYFAYRVYSVRNKLSDIVNLNISMYAASLLDISVYKSTDKLVHDISLEVQHILDIPSTSLINSATRNGDNQNDGRLDDRVIAIYIERVSELQTLCERLIATAHKRQ